MERTDPVSRRTQARVITTVLFDLDGTLYDRDALLQELAAEQYRVFRQELRRVQRNHYVERLIELDDHGYGSKDDVYRQLASDWQLSDELRVHLTAHFWSSYDRYCVLASDTLNTLSTLQRRGKKLGIITNGNTDRQNAKIDALGIRPYFHVVTISEAEGVRKPDREIFLRTLKRCGSSPAEALYVGDHPHADVDGARGAGLAAVWKMVSYWKMDVPDVPRINRLSEVVDLLGG